MSHAARELLERNASASVLARLVNDPSKSLAVRARAAETLGKAEGPRSRAALASALESGHPRLVRQAAYSLGRVGIAADRDVLSPPATEGAQTSRVMGFARSLISYRLGLGTDLLEPPRRLSRIVTSKARSIDAAPVTSARVRAAIDSTTAGPVPLTSHGALHVTCDGIETIVALARDLRHEGGSSMLARNRVVGTVLRPVRGGAGLVAHLYVMSHPSSTDGVEVFAVRRTGVVALHGSGVVDQDAFAFELRTAEGLRAPTMLFVGRYEADTGSFGFSQAFVSGPIATLPGSTRAWA